MKTERWIFWLVATIGLISCLFYGGKLFAEPFKLNPTGCKFYAHDAEFIAMKRDLGASEEAVLAGYNEMGYSTDIKPHLDELISFVFHSSLTPEEAEHALHVECLRNDGWLGKDRSEM